MGNYSRVPASFEFFADCGKVFFGLHTPQYLFDALLITVPKVVGTAIPSCMTGFALGSYRFCGALLAFSMVIAGHFVPFRIPTPDPFSTAPGAG